VVAGIDGVIVGDVVGEGCTLSQDARCNPSVLRHAWGLSP
jgi:hypothetical protein